MLMLLLRVFPAICAAYGVIQGNMIQFSILLNHSSLGSIAQGQHESTIPRGTLGRKSPSVCLCGGIRKTHIQTLTGTGFSLPKNGAVVFCRSYPYHRPQHHYDYIPMVHIQNIPRYTTVCSHAAQESREGRP